MVGVSVGRRLLYTTPSSYRARGLMGFGFLKVNVGDEIWMLKGGKVLYALRPESVTEQPFTSPLSMSSAIRPGSKVSLLETNTTPL
jgi:hypothetical protein